MPPRRKRSGSNNPGQGKNPAAGAGKGNASRRRSTPSSSSSAPRETASERVKRLRNTGAVPRSSREEKRTFESRRVPTSINSQPDHTPAEVRAWIDDASNNLSLNTQQALKRAEWYHDDTSLLPVRPTHTSDDTRPRTLAAGWDYKSQTLFVRFRGKRMSPDTFADGVGYEYYNVTQVEWERFRDNWSPGRYINDVLDTHPYTPATW
jgi:hypothetical protein